MGSDLDFKAFVEQVKEAVSLAEVIELTGNLTVVRRGKYWKTQEHDSLSIDERRGWYEWYSKGGQAGARGDVITWLQHWGGQRDFKEAMRWLCNKAGMEYHWSAEETAAFKAKRVKWDAMGVAADYFQQQMLGADGALAYCQARGWNADLVKRARLGYWDGNKEGLVAHLKMHNTNLGLPSIRALMKMPRDMLVYTHWERGRCVYLSGRSIEGKRHWNLPSKEAGSKHVYWNDVGNETFICVVEGQADAVSLAAWGLPGVALAGLSATDDLSQALSDFDELYILVDGDEAGARALQPNATVGKLIASWGPLARVVTLPDGINDANEWLAAGAPAADVKSLMGDAPIYARWLCRQVARCDPMERGRAQKRAVEMVARLPEFVFAEEFRGIAKDLEMTQGQLRDMVRAVQNADKAKAKGAIKIELEQPNGYLEGHLFELIYDPNHEDGPRTAFVVRDPDGNISSRKAFDTDSYRITPFPQ